jgi:hypothetical protein
MGWMNQIGGLLQKYAGSSAESPHPDTVQDFGRVSQTAPASSISAGLADAFRSNSTPPFGQMVAGLFGNSSGEQRAGILNHLIGSVPQSALSGGLLGSLTGLLGSGSNITPQQAQQVSPEAVQQLAEHAEKHDPSIVDKASQFYSEHPTLVQGLGAGALALVMSRISQHR